MEGCPRRLKPLRLLNIIQGITSKRVVMTINPMPRLVTELKPKHEIKVDLDDRSFLFPDGKSINQLVFLSDGRMISLKRFISSINPTPLRGYSRLILKTPKNSVGGWSKPFTASAPRLSRQRAPLLPILAEQKLSRISKSRTLFVKGRRYRDSVALGRCNIVLCLPMSW